MKTLLSALADGTLTGIARWYATNHARNCPGCGAALASLQTLRDRLRTLGVPAEVNNEPPLTLTPERRARLNALLDTVDQQGDPR